MRQLMDDDSCDLFPGKQLQDAGGDGDDPCSGFLSAAKALGCSWISGSWASEQRLELQTLITILVLFLLLFLSFLSSSSSS